MIVYRLTYDGAFCAGDTETGHTAYAYSTSPHAVEARRYPARVAEAMIQAANAEAKWMSPDILDRYDTRQWAGPLAALR